MKIVVALLFVGLTASAAVAGLDPNPDSFGIYFDTQGNVLNQTIGVFMPFTVYLLLMNPRGATDGFECTVTTVGAPRYILSTTLPAGAVDTDPSADGFAVSSPTPFVAVNGAMILCTWQYMLQAPAELDFFIAQATNPSLAGGLPVVSGGGAPRRCGVSSGDVHAPVAYVNCYSCWRAMERGAFGAVKSLFR